MRFKTYDDVKGHLFFRLWSRDAFRKYEQTLPHQIFGDIILSCMIDTEHLTGRPGAMNASWPLLKYLRTPITQMFADAYESAPSVRPVKTETFADVIEDMFGVRFIASELNMTAITTVDNLFGAATIFYPGVLESVSQGRNLILFPSSIHEFLYIVDDGSRNPLSMQQMVRDINAAMVEPEDRLSDHLYYFKGHEKKLCMIRIRERMAM